MHLLGTPALADHFSSGGDTIDTTHLLRARKIWMKPVECATFKLIKFQLLKYNFMIHCAHFHFSNSY